MFSASGDHSYKAGYHDRTHYISSTGFFHDKISWYEPNLAWHKVTRYESIIGPFFGLRPNLDEEILWSSKWWRLIQIRYCWCENFSHLVIPWLNSCNYFNADFRWWLMLTQIFSSNWYRSLTWTNVRLLFLIVESMVGSVSMTLSNPAAWFCRYLLNFYLGREKTFYHCIFLLSEQNSCRDFVNISKYLGKNKRKRALCKVQTFANIFQLKVLQSISVIY